MFDFEMKQNNSEEIAKFWFEIMWSKPDLTIADKIVDPNYNPSWIHINKIGAGDLKQQTKPLNLKVLLFYTLILKERLLINGAHFVFMISFMS